MYSFVNCLQFNIRYEKVERPAPVGGALVLYFICLRLECPMLPVSLDCPFLIASSASLTFVYLKKFLVLVGFVFLDL